MYRGSSFASTNCESKIAASKRETTAPKTNLRSTDRLRRGVCKAGILTFMNIPLRNRLAGQQHSHLPRQTHNRTTSPNSRNIQALPQSYKSIDAASDCKI